MIRWEKTEFPAMLLFMAPVVRSSELFSIIPIIMTTSRTARLISVPLLRTAIKLISEIIITHFLFSNRERTLLKFLLVVY